MISSFVSLKSDAYFRSQDPQDPRLSSFRVEDPKLAAVHLWAYPDDEGIRLNGGRPGASEGPHHIRQAFYKMTPGPSPRAKIWDAGDLLMNEPLPARHERAARCVQESLEAGKFVITLGGGHDYAYPDGKGFLKAFARSRKKPVILNFDAHLDVRPLDKGLTSGTPFYRLLTEFPKAFHFFEVGPQEHCNSQVHWDWCTERGGKVLSLQDIRKKGLLSLLKASLSRYKGHPTFLSVDIDGFSSAIAPGCSQSWPTGLHADEFFESLDYLMRHLAVKNLGVYEVSPPLDLGPLTSRLAALILNRSLIDRRSRR